LLLSALATAQTAPDGTVDGTANLRAAPDPRAEIVGQLDAGAAVSLLGRDATGRWLSVEAANAVSGWLPLFAVLTEADILALPVVVSAEATPEAGDVHIEAYGRVNVRAAPTVTAEVVGQLDGGEVLPALARDSDANNWLLIALPDAPDVQGWVAYFTVGVEGDPNQLPVLTVDAADALVLPEALVSARFNARLHTEPALASPTLVVVPFGEQVEPLARTADGAWLYVRFGETVGWGAARLFDLSSRQAGALPVYAPAAGG
jgi:uncharacterized protein YgiM (DUF1202 family)